MWIRNYWFRIRIRNYSDFRVRIRPIFFGRSLFYKQSYGLTICIVIFLKPTFAFTCPVPVPYYIVVPVPKSRFGITYGRYLALYNQVGTVSIPINRFYNFKQFIFQKIFLWWPNPNSYPGSKMLSSDPQHWLNVLVPRFGSCEQFWSIYSHLVRPGDLSSHSDFHLFKMGIKPMWEDETNRSINAMYLWVRYRYRYLGSYLQNCGTR